MGILSIILIENDRIIVTGGGDASIKLWSVGSFSPIATLLGHESGVRSLLSYIRADNCLKYLISASDDKNIIIWDIMNIK